MSTKKNVKVNLNNPTRIKCRAPGKWDKITSHTFTDWDQTYSIQMENYNGFNYSQEESFESPNKFNFSNTVLPWKWDYNFKLSTSKYCLMPVNGGQDVTTYTANGTIVGSPTFDTSTGVMRDFSNISYLQFKDSFSSTITSVDIIFKGYITNFSGHSVLIAHSSTNEQYYGVRTTNQTFSIYNNGWTDGTNTLDLNTWYWFRVTFDGTTWTGYTLEDNNYTKETLPDISNWRTEWTTSTGWIASVSANIGYNYAVSSEYWKGSIDLSQSYIKINNETWWTGTNTVTQHNMYKNITELDYAYNFNVVGSPSINNETKVVSGFSTSNHLQMSSYPTNALSFEIVIKFQTGSFTGTWQAITGQTTTNITNPQLGIDTSNNLTFGLPVEAGNWGTSILYPIAENTIYWAKMTWDGTQKEMLISTDGETYTSAGVVSQSTAYWVEPLQIGSDLGITPFLGSIDLSESYIKINGSDWWVPEFTKTAIGTMDTTQGTPKLNYDKQTIDGTSISGNNLIYSPNVFNPGNNSWEIRTKVITGSSFSGTFFNNPVDQRGIRVGQYPSNYWQLLISRGTSWITTSGFYNSYTTNPNSPYWVKIGFDGSSRYYLDVSSDGNSYTRVVTYTSSYKISSDQPIYFSYWNGEIDISETVVTIGGNIWWNPEILPSNESLPGCTYNYTDNGQETTLNAFVVDGDDSVVLTPDSSYTNGWKLGTVNIPEHDVYTYDDGEWSLVISE